MLPYLMDWLGIRIILTAIGLMVLPILLLRGGVPSTPAWMISVLVVIIAFIHLIYGTPLHDKIRRMFRD